MESKHNFIAVLALGVGLLGTAATAQNAPGNADDARAKYATVDSGQSGLLRQADWDDHRRCDGDHDRDDRGCWYYGPNGRRYYSGDGYYGPSNGNGYYARNDGWYDRKGNFYPHGADGYFDKHGKWHYFHGHKRD